MSTNSKDPVIKRFTYDWLIRFAELYPFNLTEDYYAEDSPENCSKPGYMPKNPKGRYNPYRLKYAAISPLFTALIAKHMPYIYYFMYVDGTIKNGKVYEYVRIDGVLQQKELELPSHKKVKILIGNRTHNFTNLTPGVITWFNDNCVFFDAGLLNITVHHDPVENVITPDELKYLFKFCRFDKVKVWATLTEPMTFSEIWPLIAHSKEILLRIKNVVYDEDFVNTLCNHRIFPITFTCYYGYVSDQVLLKFFDFILSLPVLPRDLYLYSMQEKPISLGETIIDKIKAAFPSAWGKKPHSKPEIFKGIQFYGHQTVSCVLFNEQIGD